MVPFAIVFADFVPPPPEETQDVSNVPVKPAAVTDFKKLLLSILTVFLMKIQIFLNSHYGKKETDDFGRQ